MPQMQLVQGFFEEDTACVSCLGCAHAEVALTDSSCPHCEKLSLAVLLNRIVLFSALFFPSRAEVKKEMQPPA